MDDKTKHALFERRKEPASVAGAEMPPAANERHQPISLGAAILLVADAEEKGFQVVFGNGETLTGNECRALKRRFKDELLLDTAAESDVAIITNNERTPGRDEPI